MIFRASLEIAGGVEAPCLGPGASTLIFNGTNGFMVQTAEIWGFFCTRMKNRLGTSGTEWWVARLKWYVCHGNSSPNQLFIAN